MRAAGAQQRLGLRLADRTVDLDRSVSESWAEPLIAGGAGDAGSDAGVADADVGWLTAYAALIACGLSVTVVLGASGALVAGAGALAAAAGAGVAAFVSGDGRLSVGVTMGMLALL